MSEKIVCENRTDEGLRFFKDETIGTIRTIDSGGDKRVIERNINVVGNYSPGGYESSRVVDKNGIAPCVKENHGTTTGVEYNYRIRKLTPNECWRLMGFTDADFKRAAAEVSNSQLYKQAGNSIVVDVLYYIYKNLYAAMPYLFENLKVDSYFSGIGAFESGLDRLYTDINSENFTEGTSAKNQLAAATV